MNMVSTMQMLGIFFKYSPKCQRKLEQFLVIQNVSQQLQGSTVELLQVCDMSSVVAAQLNDIRDDAASEFQNVFTKCQDMTSLADTTITVPRTVSRQNLRDNVEHENAEQYYRRTVFIPFLDCLVQQLNDRFQAKTKDTIKVMYLIPSNLSDVDD